MLQSARLAYEELRPDHAEVMFAILDDAAVWRHIDGRDGASVDEVRRRYARWQRGPDAPGVRWLNWAVRLPDGPFIGRVQATVHHTAPDRWAEVAYVIGRAHWGHGYGREATAWLRDRLVADGIRELWAAVAPGNTASRRLLHALGFAKDAAGGDPSARHLDSEDPGDLRFCWRAKAAPGPEAGSEAFRG